MSSLRGTIFTGSGIVAGVIAVIQSPAPICEMDKIINVAVSIFLLVKREGIRTSLLPPIKDCIRIQGFQGPQESQTLSMVQHRLEEVYSNRILEYLAAVPNYFSLMQLIYQAVSPTQGSNINTPLHSNFNSSFNLSSNSNATIQNQTFDLTNNSNYTNQKSTNTSRVKPLLEKVYADANNSEMATPTGMDLPMAAAATALAAAGIFAVYKYREHQKGLRDIQAQKALDEALAKKAV